MKLDAPQKTRRNQVWAVDLSRFDLKRRMPLVMLVVDVHSRLPLSATASPTTPGATATALDRILRRRGAPDEIWIDRNIECDTAVRHWATQNGISVAYGSRTRMKALTEPFVRDLDVFFLGNLFSTLAELSLGLEKWRQHYAVEPRLSNVNR